MRRDGRPDLAGAHVGKGNAACCREYGCVHSSTSLVGGVRRVLRRLSSGPLSRRRSPGSRAYAISASQKPIELVFDSLSVGSIIIVPATGNDTVAREAVVHQTLRDILLVDRRPPRAERPEIENHLVRDTAVVIRVQHVVVPLQRAFR